MFVTAAYSLSVLTVSRCFYLLHEKKVPSGNPRRSWKVTPCVIFYFMFVHLVLCLGGKKTMGMNLQPDSSQRNQRHQFPPKKNTNLLYNDIHPAIQKRGRSIVFFGSVSFLPCALIEHTAFVFLIAFLCLSMR
jgi:hypothetical protein